MARKIPVKTIRANNQPDAWMVSDSWSGFIDVLTSGAETGLKHTRAKRDTKCRLDETKLDKICRNDSIAVTICEIFASDMVSPGITVNDKSSKKVYDFYDKWKFPVLLEECIFYHNFYGGGAIVMDVDDGSDENSWEQPLNLANVRGINELFVVDRFFLQPKDYNNPVREPDVYYLQYGSKQVVIHKSRMIILPGLNAGKRNRYENNGFGESLVFRAITEIDNYHDAHDMMPNIIEQYLTNIFKFKNMMKNIKEGHGKKIRDKARYLQAVKNPLGALVIDMDDDYIPKTLNTSGIEKLVEQPERKLCATVGLTHTRLLQESPGGGLTNNGGKSEQSTQHNKKIRSEQVKYVCPAYDQFNAIAQMVLKLGKKPIKYELNPLEQQTKTEIVNDKYKSAQTKQIYNDMTGGALTEAIIEQTFGQGYYSEEMEISPAQMDIIRKTISEYKANKAKALFNKPDNNSPNGENSTNNPNLDKKVS